MNEHDRRVRLVVGVLLAVLAIAALRDLARLGDALPWRNMDDFPDFYCAGDALDRQMSPYFYEPLHACEHRVNAGETFRGKLFARYPAVAVPAPQPPFDFPPFMALAHMPFGTARIVYAVAIIVAVATVAAGLAALGVPLDLALASLVLSAGYVQLNSGQIVPFALLALVLCGLALARGRDAIAGFLAALTAIEPTIGLPVVIAVLLFVPKARWTIAVTAVLLGGIALELVGLRGLSLYLTQVLPAHAVSELRFPFQYSSTYVLTYVGAPLELARSLAALLYVLGVTAGVWLAPRVARTLDSRTLLVFLPALFAVSAAPFLHQEELALAIPAALVLATRTRGREQVVAAIALCVLSIPWIVVWSAKPLFLASIFVCAVILLRLRIDGRVTLTTLCALAAAIYVFELHSPQLPLPSATALRVYAPDEIVQAAWRDYAQARATNDPLWFVVKLPAWASLLAFVALAALHARNHRAGATTPLGDSISRRI